MGNCKITTWKFKELPLQDPQEPTQSFSPSNSSNSYHHDNENELFLVGYKYIDSTKCPEIKVRLSDIMRGGGDDSGGDGGGCDYDLALRYDPTNNRLYYSLDGDTTGSKTEWVDLSALDTSFNSISFNWLPTGSTANAGIENGTLYLSLPTPSGSGGGSTLPINNVVVNQNAQTPSGTYADGTLTLNLVPGAQGPQGQKGAKGDKGDKGEDGASFKLYKVKLQFGSSDRYEAKTHNNGITVYKLTATRTWYQYNPTGNTYVRLQQQPVIGNKYVEVGPSDIWSETGEWSASANYYIPGLNAYFNTYGFYDYNNQSFEFYSASATEPNTIGLACNYPLQFSVKVYESIEYDGSGNYEEPDVPTDSDYCYTLTGDFANRKALLTNSTLPSGVAQKSGSGSYYFIYENNVDVLYDGDHVKVRIPADKKITQVYQYNNGEWMPQTTPLGHFLTPVQDQNYKYYSYEDRDTFGDPNYGTVIFCFDIEDDDDLSSETPHVDVDENNDNT